MDAHRKSRALCKGFVITFNIFFVIFGLGAIAIGIWFLFDAALFDRFNGINKFLYPCSVLIAAGILMLFVTGCGFYGVPYEHQYMLKTFIAFTLLVAVAKLVAGGLVFEYRLSVRHAINRQTLIVIKEQYGIGDRQIDHDVDLLQERLKCCGARGYADYKNSTWINAYDSKTKFVPESCCSNPKLCTKSTNLTVVYLRPCDVELHTFTDKYFIVLGSVCVGMGGLEFIGACFTCYLSSVVGPHIS